jgi:hypothetical protein
MIPVTERNCVYFLTYSITVPSRDAEWLIGSAWSRERLSLLGVRS